MKFPMLWSASATAVLAVAFAPAMWTQVGKTPISAVVVGGLDSAAGAKILLIRAAGEGCQDSVVIPVDAGGAAINQFYSLAGDEKKSPVKRILSKIARKNDQPTIYRTAIRVSAGCWCSDPEAGLAVMAPGKAVAYRSDQESLRRPTANEKKKSNQDVKIFGLCTSNEIEIDMRPRREVPVTVWVNDGQARAMARDDLANFDWILDKELAGITVRPVYRLLSDPHSLEHDLSACYPNRDQDACCASVRQSRLFDAGALNLYYGVGSGNFTCPDVPASFVHDAPILGDAAHELGHALGLSQSDHLENYSSGHTRGHPIFHWTNVMWDRTQYLKNKLSVAQAFWMSQSCRSWFGLNGSCLNCPEKAPDGNLAESSPCPPLSAGAEGPPGPLGEPCSGAPACDARKPPEGALLFVPARQKRRVENCEVPLSIYKDGKSLENQLKERFIALRQQVRGREDLSLGSVSSWDFLFRWEPSFAFNIAPLSPQDPWLHEFQEKDAIPHALFLPSRAELAKRPLPACGPLAPEAQQ